MAPRAPGSRSDKENAGPSSMTTPLRRSSRLASSQKAALALVEAKAPDLDGPRVLLAAMLEVEGGAEDTDSDGSLIIARIGALRVGEVVTAEEDEEEARYQDVPEVVIFVGDDDEEEEHVLAPPQPAHPAPAPGPLAPRAPPAVDPVLQPQPPAQAVLPPAPVAAPGPLAPLPRPPAPQPHSTPLIEEFAAERGDPNLVAKLSAVQPRISRLVFQSWCDFVAQHRPRATPSDIAKTAMIAEQIQPHREGKIRPMFKCLISGCGVRVKPPQGRSVRVVVERSNWPSGPFKR